MAKPVVRDALTTTSAEGKRIKIFPAEVRGKWTNRRQWVQWGLIALYLVIPWIRVGGHPLLLLDIANRRFSVFGQLFFAREVPNLVFLALIFLFGVGLLTAWFGRAWCGWACPQTVFIERVFRAVERVLEGNALERKRLHQGRWTIGKFLKKSAKWGAFIAIALVLSHSFLAYFVGSEASFGMMTRSPFESPRSFVLVLLFSGVVLFDFGWFREQFCLVACPYGRFQSVMMDDSSLFVHYHRERQDCIDCYRCVSVCPTGIDIRNGVQMECIACTACVDACDLVMDKIKKPRGLISYASIASIAGKPFRFLRARPLVYLALLLISLSILAIRLAGREAYSIEVTRAVDIPYQVLKDREGSELVLNHFKVHLANMGWDALTPEVLLEEGDRARGIELVLPPGFEDPVRRTVESGDRRDFDLFVKIPKSALDSGSGKGKIQLLTRWNREDRSLTPVKLIGPANDL